MTSLTSAVKQDIDHAAIMAHKVPYIHDAIRMLQTLRQDIQDITGDKNEQTYKMLSQYVKDFQGLEYGEGGAVNRALMWTLRKFYPQALGAKLQVGTGQMASWSLAKAEIPWRFRKSGLAAGLIQAWRGSTELAQTAEWAAIRFQHVGTGFADPGEAAGYTTSLGQPGIVKRIVKKGMSHIPFFDRLTLGRIYIATRAQGKSKGLTGDALKQYAAKETKRIVDETQPTFDNPMQMTRLQLYAKKHVIVKPLTWFSTQPIKSVNYAMNAYLDAEHGDISKAKATEKIFRATVEQTVSLTLLRHFASSGIGIVGITASHFMWPDEEDDRGLVDKITDLLVDEFDPEELGWEAA